VEHALLLMEVSLHIERHLSVDGVLSAWSVLTWRVIVDIESALAVSIAVIVLAIDSRVALVACRMEGVLVCLLNVELGAPMTTNLVSIAVPKIVVVVDGRH